MSDTSRLNLDLLPTECFHLIAQNYSLEGLIELAKNLAASSAQDPMLFSHGKRHLGEDSNYALAPRPRLLQPNEKEAIRAGALQVIDEHLQLLVQNNVRLMGKPGQDEPHLILEQSLQEQQREIAALFLNVDEDGPISAKQNAELATAASITSTYVGDLIAIDALLNELNMSLIQPHLDAYEAKPEGQQQHLHLGKLQLTRLPEELIVKLQRYPRLTSLGLFLNRLSTLPDSFCNLVALTHLELGCNQLITLPKSFGNLTALIVLELWKNQLTFLPKSFGNLVTLTSLDLTYNQLSALPNSFSNLGGLTKLWMTNNPFLSLPESIQQILIRTNNEDLLTLLAPAPVHMDESDDGISATYTPSAAEKKPGKKRKAEEENASPENSAAEKEKASNKRSK